MNASLRKAARAALLAGALALALFASSCGGAGAGGGGGGGTGNALADELAAVAKLADEKQAKIEALAARARGAVTELEGLCQEIEAFRGTTTAKAIERRLAPFLESPAAAQPEREQAAGLVKRFEELATRTDAVLDAARASFEKAAGDALGRVESDVATALAAAGAADIAAADDPYGPARVALDGFPKKFAATAAAKGIDALRTKVDAAARASDRARDVIAKATRMRGLRAYDRALGILEGFTLIKEFAGTKPSAAVEALLAEVRAEAASAAEQKAEEEKLPWVELFAASNTSLPTDWNLQYGEWEVSDGELLGRAEGTKGAFIYTGSETWVDYIVEIELNINRGGCDLKLRGMLDEESKKYMYDDAIELDESRFARAAWHRVRVEVRGNRRTALRLDTFDEIDPAGATLENEHGGIGVFIHGSGEVRFRAIRVKILKESK